MNAKRAKEFRKMAMILTQLPITDPVCRKVYRKAKKDYTRNATN